MWGEFHRSLQRPSYVGLASPNRRPERVPARRTSPPPDRKADGMVRLLLAATP
jgi:hypothetical protein